MIDNFVTCDLLDAHEQDNVQVVPVDLNGYHFRSYGGRQCFAGQAVTVKCFEDNSRVKEQLATDGHGKILVVDGGGSMRCALMGDLIALSAVEHQWSGVIIYGCVRDVDALAQLHLGVQALAAIPRKSVRKGVGEVGVNIYFGDVCIAQDDYLYVDNNGILVSKISLI